MNSPNPYVFLVGCPRSGTTLLQRLVDAHAQLAITPETHWIARYFEKRRWLTPEGCVTHKFVRKLLAYAKFAALGVGRPELKALLRAQEPLSYAAFVSGLFDLYGKAQGKSLVGDKTPAYARHLPTLHALWPQGRFIHLIRDGRDVCLSAVHWQKPGKLLSRSPLWAQDRVSTAALWWEWHVRLGREAGGSLSTGLYREVRYEALVAHPEEECAGMCAFLGLPYDPAMPRFHERPPRADQPLHAWAPVTAGLRDWRTQMPPEDVERFEAAAGGLLAELGYPRACPHPRPDALRQAGHFRDVFAREASREGPLPTAWQQEPSYGQDISVHPRAAPHPRTEAVCHAAQVRETFAQAAGRSKGKSVQELSGQLESPKAKARRHAAEELRTMGPAAKDAVPALAKALKDDDPKVRRKAAKALREMAAGACEATPALSEALKDPDPTIRQIAAMALARIGQPASEAVPAGSPTVSPETLRERRRVGGWTNPFVFVVGSPRSGTTLLQRILNTHPDLAICPESSWIPYYFKKRIGLTPEGLVTPELISRLFEHYKFYRMKVGRDELAGLIRSGEPVTYSSFVSGLFDLYGEIHGKPLAGDKTPGYAHNLPTLHALWPEAKFIHLIRDGRDVCLSAINWKRKAVRLASRFTTWGEEPVATAAAWWEWRVRLAREGGRPLGPERYCEVRYEALVERPAEECARLCAFLGVPYDGSMLCFHEGHTRAGDGRDAKAAWLPVTPGLRDWRVQMAAADVECFEAVAGAMLDELGYPRAALHPRIEVVAYASRIRNQFARDSQALGDWLP